jgi:AraC-like DNA-binding protein
MIYSDIKMSNIDISNQGYVKTAMEEQESPLLDIMENKHYYPFYLHTFHYSTQMSGPVKQVKEHNHKVYHIVLYTSGENYFLLKGKKVLSRPGTLVITKPGEYHDFSPLERGLTAYHEITFSFGEQMIYEKSFSEILTYFSGREYSMTPSTLLLSTRRLRWADIIFETLKTELKDHQKKSWFKIKKNILELFDFIGEEFPSLRRREERKSEDPLYFIKDYMETNYSEINSLHQLADRAGMTPEHFCRKFRALFHTSPMVYRRQLQVSASETLLKNTGMLCKEIAFYLGFSDVYSFSKAFKKEKGMSPSEYRLGHS